jgi:hypothetical protein
MAAAAHTKGGYGGVPQSVGRDFNSKDKGTAMLSKGMHPQTTSYAAGGPVLGRVRDFIKEGSPFVTNKETQDYTKGKSEKEGASKTLKTVKPKS